MAIISPKKDRRGVNSTPISIFLLHFKAETATKWKKNDQIGPKFNEGVGGVNGWGPQLVTKSYMFPFFIVDNVPYSVLPSSEAQTNKFSVKVGNLAQPA